MSKGQSNRTCLLKILTVIGVLGVSSSIPLPASAQINPLFNPYTIPNSTIISPSAISGVDSRGTFVNPSGITTTPDGTAIRFDGWISYPNGVIISPYGWVSHPNGTVISPTGWVSNLNGTVVSPVGEIITFSSNK